MILTLLFAFTLMSNPTFCEHYPDWFFHIFFMEYNHGISYKQMMAEIYYLQSIHAIYTYQAPFVCR